MNHIHRCGFQLWTKINHPLRHPNHAAVRLGIKESRSGAGRRSTPILQDFAFGSGLRMHLDM